jgi:hypothetical protein
VVSVQRWRWNTPIPALQNYNAKVICLLNGKPYSTLPGTDLYSKRVDIIMIVKPL